MKKFAKKAFTLVELLVVIAIIAILAVAGVVGYMAFTKKAEVNNDTSLVAELNNYVSAASATDKINTPTDIRNILVDDGIDLATLKLSAAKQGYVPGFDIVAKKFVLIKDNALVDGYTAAKTSDVFAFAKTEAEANALKAAGFSLYLQSGYDKATIDVSGLGLDVGENTGITTINYTGASSANNVVIRTNGDGCSLTVNAPNDTVHHYNRLDELTVTAVDPNNSYHEHGAIRCKATVSAGHFVVEQGAEVLQVEVKAATNTVKVTANSSTIVTVDTASATQTSVVANANDVYIDGVETTNISGSNASSVKLPTEVTTEAGLKAAFTEGGFVKLGANITLTTFERSYTRKQDSTVTENAIVNTNSKVVFDLNGYSVVSGAGLDDDINFFAIGDNGSLKIYDSSSSKTGQLVANAKLFYVRGSLEIESGTYLTTVLCSGTDLRSMIIADSGSNLTINDGLFYTPKCVLTSWADTVVVNGGLFVCASCTSWSSVPQSKSTTSWAYVLRLGDGENYINGGTFYGTQGGISLEGGRSTVKNATVDVSGEALAKFSEFTNDKIKIHPLGKRSDEFYVTSDIVSSYQSTFNTNSHYAIYVAGEENVVYATVESGIYATGHKYAVYIGNNNDGGKGFYAHCTINGGKFTAPQGKAAVYETGLNITYGAGYTEIFGGEFSTDVTSLMKNTSDYSCTQGSGGTWVVSRK